MFGKLNTSRLFVLVFSIFMVGAVSVVTYKTISPKPAVAQSCSCELCTAISGGISTAVMTITSNTFLVEVINIFTTLLSLYNTVINAFGTVVPAALGTADANLENTIETLLVYDIRPAQQDMTAQLNTAIIDQSRNLASFSSATQQQVAQQRLQENVLDAHKDATPSEGVCEIASSSVGMTRARVISESLSNALTRKDTGDGGNADGSRAQFGNAQYQAQKYQNYLTFYCNPAANAGNGCFAPPNITAPAAPTPLMDHDILVHDVLFKTDTIDFTDVTQEREQVIEDLTRNLVEPEADSPIPLSAIDSVDTRERYLKRRSTRTKKSLAKKTISDVVSRRSPGSQARDFILPLRQSAGVDLQNISDNPSYNEVVNALVEERFQSGVYNLGVVDNREAISRENVALQALEVLRINDRLKLLDMVSTMIASQAAQEIIETGGLSGGELTDAPSSN